MRVILVLVLLLAAPGVMATLTDPLQNDAGTGGDAGNTFETATRLASPNGRSIQGVTFAIDDPQDWYKFAIQPLQPRGQPSGGNASSPIRVYYTMDSATGCIDAPVPLTSRHVALVDPNGEVRDSADSTTCTFHGVLAANATVAGDWRLKFETRVDIAGPVGLRASSMSQGQQLSVEDMYNFIVECKPQC